MNKVLKIFGLLLSLLLLSYYYFVVGLGAKNLNQVFQFAVIFLLFFILYNIVRMINAKVTYYKQIESKYWKLCKSIFKLGAKGNLDNKTEILRNSDIKDAIKWGKRFDELELMKRH